MAVPRNEFGTLDYVLFGITLAISLSIGVFNAFKYRNKQSTKEYLLAGGNMGVVPVALSLFASFMSSIAIIGVPAEIYVFNTMLMWAIASYPIAIFLSAHIYIPIFYNLKLTSAYEYLELRFNRVVRTLVIVCFCIYMILYMSIVLYAPALAFNAVTGFSLWGAVLSVGIVCTIYTAIGGMKAVLWTDCFQAFLMFIGAIVTLIWGSVKIGGMTEAWRIADEHQRIKLNDFSLNPYTRYTVWGTLFGQAMMWTTLYGTNQAQIQRTLACSTLKGAQKALWLSCPGLMLIILLGCLNGVVLFAFYHQCDPITAGTIKAGDQVLPLFVMEIMGKIPGLPGLFIASVFSGSLSTVSSGLNSMSAVLLQDIIKPFIAPEISDERAAIISKALGGKIRDLPSELYRSDATQISALVLGVICLLFSYLASVLGGIVQAAVSMFGIMGSPVLGVITLGMIFPWANSKGAISGTVASMGMMLWIGIGSFMYKSYPKSPVSTEGCSNYTLYTFNTTTTYNDFTYSTALPIEDKSDTGFPLYELSFSWYTVIAPAIVIVVGLVVSFLTGHNDPKSIDARLIVPVFDIMFPYLPEKIREYLRFGIVHKDKYKIQRIQSKMIRDSQILSLDPDNPDEIQTETLIVINRIEERENGEAVEAKNMINQEERENGVAVEVKNASNRVDFQ